MRHPALRFASLALALACARPAAAQVEQHPQRRATLWTTAFLPPAPWPLQSAFGPPEGEQDLRDALLFQSLFKPKQTGFDSSFVVRIAQVFLNTAPMGSIGPMRLRFKIILK